jgi:hypothetical protein
MATETCDPPLFASVWCHQYWTQAKFWIADKHPSGLRHLVCHYDEGGYKNEPSFAAAIPDDWTEAEIRDLLLRPTRPDAPYPPWEVPARVYGSETLFRWWRGEKSQ